MSFTDYLARNPRPTEDGLRDVLSGHICRCTGYAGIMAALMEATASGAEEGAGAEPCKCASSAITSSAFPTSRSPTLLAKYAARDPGKTAIVDLEQDRSITFGELDRAATDIAADLKRRGIGKGGRVLLLSDENLEKLLIWLGVWRIGAVVCPFNLEINEKQMVELTRGARSGADRLPQGHRRCGDGRRPPRAARALRRLGGGRRARQANRPAG